MRYRKIYAEQEGHCEKEEQANQEEQEEQEEGCTSYECAASLPLSYVCCSGPLVLNFCSLHWILFGGHPLKLERYRED